MRVGFIRIHLAKENPSRLIDGFCKVTCFTGGFQILVDSIRFDNLYELE